MSIFSAKLRVLEGDRASVAAGGVLRVPGFTLLFVRCASRAPSDEFKHTLNPPCTIRQVYDVGLVGYDKVLDQDDISVDRKNLSMLNRKPMTRGVVRGYIQPPLRVDEFCLSVFLILQKKRCTCLKLCGSVRRPSVCHWAERIKGGRGRG